ncbi:hypothetical protein [Methylobacterium sp. Leaf466]|uniref:hypothetical protein n=1 Tax=Methylobacterium sp. Leaf466 TaxID=1736386 RepID=UPI0006F4C539|nr:hypothetical protein [Methylobacterium sp. Leaf466]KQT81078.1 hypothetical protein ASG59_19370 [Methylobacterium sp. Leaf466]
MRFPKTLADYPYVLVRLRCGLCPGRRGRYRLARLAERFGAAADLDMVRRALAAPCHRLEDKGSGMRPGCRVEYGDLDRPPHPPPDLPADRDA